MEDTRVDLPKVCGGIDKDPSEVLLSPVELETDHRVKPVIIARDDWGAAKPRATMETIFPFMRVFYTMNTQTEECFNRVDCTRVMQQMQKHHMQTLNLSDIKYNFLVAGDGTIYEGRGWNVRSSKSLEFNPHFYDQRVDIAYIGDFRDRNPPNAQLEAGLELVIYGEFLKHIHLTRDVYSLRGEKDGDWSKWPPKKCKRILNEDDQDYSELIRRGKRGKLVDKMEELPFPADYDGIEDIVDC